MGPGERRAGVVCDQCLTSIWPAFDQHLTSNWQGPDYRRAVEAAPVSDLDQCLTSILTTFWPVFGQCLTSIWPLFGRGPDERRAGGGAGDQGLQDLHPRLPVRPEAIIIDNNIQYYYIIIYYIIIIYIIYEVVYKTSIPVFRRAHPQDVRLFIIYTSIHSYNFIITYTQYIDMIL